MRFLGLVLALSGIAVAYFLGYREMSIDQARTRLAQLLNLPGLAPPGSAGSTPADQVGNAAPAAVVKALA